MLVIPGLATKTLVTYYRRELLRVGGSAMFAEPSNFLGCRKPLPIR